MTIGYAKQLAENGTVPRLAGDLELLAAISQDFAGSPAMSETLANAVRQIMAYMDAEAASIFLLDAENEKLTCMACGGPVSIEGLTIAKNQGIVGRALSSKAVQMVRDVSEDKDFNTAVDDSTGFNTCSILCAPLMVKERMRRELDLAREIQRDLLPDQPAADFPVQGLNLSAFEVSGDFYDFFRLADGRIAWGLGDVSGKGMNAAMLMAKTISLFRCLGKTVHDPARLLAMLNDEIVETASRGMFVTMAAGIFDPQNGVLEFANAGHQPPLLRSCAGEYCEIEESSPPLGIVSGMEYTVQKVVLDGGRLYVFTDGVTEGWAEDGKMLELAGLKMLLDQHAGLPMADQLVRISEVLTRPGVRLRDDLTLLVIG